MAMLCFFCGLLGCQKAPKKAKHELSELTAVSISCGNMDRRYSYSFSAKRQENGWLLDAECFTRDRETETVLENRALDSEDASMLLDILEQNESIAYLENYKKTRAFRFWIADETTYGFCLTFSDGSRYTAPDRQSDLEELFYRLADKYDEQDRNND